PSLFSELDDEPEPPQLPEQTLNQQVLDDYRTAGMSLKAHPMELVRPDLQRLKVTPAAELAVMNDKEDVRVAGLVLGRQRPPTAKGVVFMTLEDETGLMNLLVWRGVWEKSRRTTGDALAVYVEGKIERMGHVIHVVPSKMENLSHRLAGLASRSRD